MAEPEELYRDHPDDDRAGGAFVRLVRLMRTLRGPDGCPWDRAQDARSLRCYVLEEACEVIAAIDAGGPEALRDELGDLLLQIVFLAQVAAERAEFTVADVAEAIHDKLVRRHPHVFGDLEIDEAAWVEEKWEALKTEERGGGSVLDDLAASLPALARAEKLGRRAAQTGFDWPDATGVLDKVHEELEELEQEIGSGPEPGDRGVEDELGDLLFAVANLGRHLGLSPEVALRRANAKFERRFRAVEDRVASGRVDAGDLDDLERAWNEAKERERDASHSGEELG